MYADNRNRNTRSTPEIESSQAPSGPPILRGPTAYHGRGQYYDVLNRFFSAGVRVRRFARFKRIGDKRGWGAPEWKEGLELDRFRFLNDWKLSQVGARIAELSADGCEFVSYRKKNAPAGMVSYLLVSWPTNRELERNRSARVQRKQPKQASLPPAAAPFQHPRLHITAESLASSPRPIEHGPLWGDSGTVQ